MSAFADPKRLYFFFDYISHNAYLAWHKLPELARAHGLELTPVPVLFGAMLSHHKQVGPAEVPVKFRWMLWNVLRKARLHGIPIAPPASHPFNPLVPLRATCAIDDDAARRRAVDRFFRATWAESRTIDQVDTVGALLDELGLPTADLLAAAQSDPVKQRLRDNTQQALELGVFGVPTMAVRGELFWGFDDLEHLARFLEGRDVLPADRSGFAAWLQIRPSIERRRP